MEGIKNLIGHCLTDIEARLFFLYDAFFQNLIQLLTFRNRTCYIKSILFKYVIV